MFQRANRGYWCICCLLLVCAGCQNGSTMRSTEVVDREFLTSGTPPSSSIQAMLAEGDVDQVEVLLTQAVADRPDSIVERSNLAILFARTGRIDIAVAELEHVLSSQPGYCPASVQLGQIYRTQLKIDAAEKLYLDCLETNPEFASALLNHGILLELYRGELSQARDRYEQYQRAGDKPNQTVSQWISILNSRLTSGAAANQIAEVR